MPTPFADFMKCSIGGDSFQLDTYNVSEEPVLKDKVGRIGTQVTVTGEGYVEADSVANLAPLLIAVRDNLKISGRDFAVMGLGGVEEYRLNAAVCIEGGPHVAFRQMTSGNVLQRRFSFTVKASTASADDGDASGGSNRYTTRIETGADGLRVVTRSGDLSGGSAQARFAGTILPAFQQAYPWPAWSVQHEMEVQSDLQLSYSIRATELAAPLPGTGPANVDRAVEGEITERKERDENWRLLTTTDFDLLMDRAADPVNLLKALRAGVVGAGANAATIMRESSQITSLTKSRLRASFTVLRSSEGDALANWRQSFTISAGETVYDEKKYPGALPVLTVRAASVRRLTQSGSATGINAFIPPPAPVLPTLLEDPERNLEAVDITQRQTTWRYVMAAVQPGREGGPNISEGQAAMLGIDTMSLEFLKITGVPLEKLLRPKAGKAI